MKTNPVKSRFAVPAAIALAGHAILFFGFSSPHPEPRQPKKDPVDIMEWPPLPLEPPDPISDSGVKPLSRETTPALPSLPDIPVNVVPVNVITVPPQPPSIGPIDRGARNIPTEWRGPEGPGGLGTNISLYPKDLDNTPRAKFQARPGYPYSLRASGIEGQVVVDFLVDEQGNVRDVRVIRSTHRDFEDATIRAVSKWKFEPGKRHGRTVSFRMAQPVGFTIGSD